MIEGVKEPFNNFFVCFQPEVADIVEAVSPLNSSQCSTKPLTENTCDSLILLLLSSGHMCVHHMLQASSVCGRINGLRHLGSIN